MRIEREHTAALIVDFQERLVPAIADHEALMERVQILLQGLKALEIPMTVTQQYTKGLGMSVPEVWEASGETEYLIRFLSVHWKWQSRRFMIRSIFWCAEWKHIVVYCRR